MTAVLAKTIEDRCGYLTDRGQCRRDGTTVVAGVVPRLCKQHARIVATEPGQSGVIRRAPVGVAEIVAELRRATTQADLDRCVLASATPENGCHTQAGMRPEVAEALRSARARVRGNRS